MGFSPIPSDRDLVNIIRGSRTVVFPNHTELTQLPASLLVVLCGKRRCFLYRAWSPHISMDPYRESRVRQTSLQVMVGGSGRLMVCRV